MEGEEEVDRGRVGGQVKEEGGREGGMDGAEAGRVGEAENELGRRRDGGMKE